MPGSVLAAAPGGVQFNKTPPEETYINRIKNKKEVPYTCKKSKEEPTICKSTKQMTNGR